MTTLTMSSKLCLSVKDKIWKGTDVMNFNLKALSVSELPNQVDKCDEYELAIANCFDMKRHKSFRAII